jgi:hypothetical protein
MPAEHLIYPNIVIESPNRGRRDCARSVNAKMFGWLPNMDMNRTSQADASSAVRSTGLRQPPCASGWASK